jgi:DNA/RNA-binding domain of Phe-tRNA-synthetase-like protein
VKSDTVKSNTVKSNTVQLEIIQHVAGVRVAVFQVDGLSIWAPTTDFDDWVVEQCERASESLKIDPSYEQRHEGVRGMLRRGGYKPSGRNKPAQEYLARCLDEGKFPRINPAVDCLNAISVRIGIPISMLDRDAFKDRLQIRLGRPQESYVFNASGQTLELENLVVVCGGDDGEKPLGSPVKDSMAGKIHETVSRIVCILYAPSECVEESALQGWAEELRSAIKRFAVAP